MHNVRIWTRNTRESKFSMIIGYGIALFMGITGIRFVDGFYYLLIIPILLPAIWATIAAVNWRINIDKDARLFAALKNPPKFSMKRYARFVSEDSHSIALFLEHVLCEFQGHTDDWDSTAIAEMLNHARETAQMADCKDYTGQDMPFYSYSRLHRSQYRKIFSVFKLAVLGYVLDNDWLHEFNVIAQKLSMDEVIVRLETTIENLKSINPAE